MHTLGCSHPTNDRKGEQFCLWLPTFVCVFKTIKDQRAHTTLGFFFREESSVSRLTRELQPEIRKKLLHLKKRKQIEKHMYKCLWLSIIFRSSHLASWTEPGETFFLCVNYPCSGRKQSTVRNLFYAAAKLIL